MRIREVAMNLLNLFLGMVGIILGLRFALKLLGANADNGFVSWIYEMSGVLLEPFRGIFSVKVFENKYVLELSTLFALLMYALLGLVIVWVINALTPSEPVVVKRRR